MIELGIRLGRSLALGATPAVRKSLYSPQATGHAKPMKSILCLLLLSPAVIFAGDLKIEDAWIRAVPSSSKSTAAFMTLVNKTDKPVLVTAGTCPVAGEVRPMITTKQGDGVMGMAFVESFSVPAKGKRILEPGGDHIMLMQLKEVPQAGSTVPMVLTTESGGKQGRIHLEVPVR